MRYYFNKDLSNKHFLIRNKCPSLIYKSNYKYQKKIPNSGKYDMGYSYYQL